MSCTLTRRALIYRVGTLNSKVYNVPHLFDECKRKIWGFVKNQKILYNRKIRRTHPSNVNMKRNIRERARELDKERHTLWAFESNSHKRGNGSCERCCTVTVWWIWVGEYYIEWSCRVRTSPVKEPCRSAELVSWLWFPCSPLQIESRVYIFR